ncbi:thioredoxin family protein [Nonomuraea sp. NPDC059007]|uniref:thioredoxin family protein n=1 Tax=Nonomuraea sp. NPDC059007 TaxID=3346692 RepID=UPI00369F89FA
MPLLTVTDASFDTEVVNAGKPVLAYFWAEWAGPCKLMTPILEKLSADYAGRLTMAALNIDQNPATLPRFREEAIPTMLLFKNGSVAGKRIGAHSEGQMREFLDALV